MKNKLTALGGGGGGGGVVGGGAQKERGESFIKMDPKYKKFCTKD